MDQTTKTITNDELRFGKIDECRIANMKAYGKTNKKVIKQNNNSHLKITMTEIIKENKALKDEIKRKNDLFVEWGAENKALKDELTALKNEIAEKKPQIKDSLLYQKSRIAELEKEKKATTQIHAWLGGYCHSVDRYLETYDHIDIETRPTFLEYIENISNIYGDDVFENFKKELAEMAKYDSDE